MGQAQVVAQQGDGQAWREGCGIAQGALTLNVALTADECHPAWYHCPAARGDFCHNSLQLYHKHSQD